ncbi:hypothetical protein SRB5_43570 [Streptomyces sp. RB5]|uniref:Carbon monoxide dehydrogenase subunit G n=1 Tax=Streptomyces smaragdinus TaxID=2585196 RepID=A0A7K0CL20_9ACTN|nr:SRPBCC domain-containing protein [Streptomyces smaragdinus]MQY14195.1 hypothetical protein [Streptomyces smaragdinus]
MEHEVYVPYPAATVRAALCDPARVARAVPGLQADAAESDPLAGRLRLRIAGSTITYRGSLRVSPGDGDAVTVSGEGAEARGGGSVALELTLTPRPADGGTTLACAGSVRAEGRLASVDGEVARGAGVRLLERFGEGLASGLASSPLVSSDEGSVDTEGGAASGEEAGSSSSSDDNERVIPGIPGPDRQPPDEEASVVEGEVPPSALDPLADDLVEEDLGPEIIEEIEDVPDPDDEPEAAHARRTMIGRSTEEVDHAPPRGRYAPSPSGEAVSAVDRLRWAAPAAAVVVAAVVVVGRALRRRR